MRTVRSVHPAWCGLVVTRSPVEDQIIAALGGVYGPYTWRWFAEQLRPSAEGTPRRIPRVGRQRNGTAASAARRHGRISAG